MVETQGRRTIWGWMSYDWAQQPYHTLLVTFIFAPYFTSTVVGDSVLGQEMWGWMMGAIGLVLAIAAPTLGAIADSTGPRKPWMALFCAMSILGATTLWIAVPGMSNPEIILWAFAFGLFGAEMSQIFNNAMLPDIVARKDIGLISGRAWGLGYAGGMVALIFMLLFLAENDAGVTLLGNAPLFGLDPELREGTRAVGPLAGLWFLVFVIPMFLFVPDVPRRAKIAGAVSTGLRELGKTLKNLPQNRSLMAYLGSSMLYRDALNGLYMFGGIYAAGVLGWNITFIGIFGIIAGLSGAVFTVLGGYLDRAIGPKKVIFICVVVLIGVCTLVVGSSRETFFGMALPEGSAWPDQVFFFCGVVIGAAGGILQSASRTMLVHQADESRMTEAFGLYALAGRATAFLAPSSIALVTRISGNQQIGIIPVVVLFLLGLILLLWVKSADEYR